MGSKDAQDSPESAPRSDKRTAPAMIRHICYICQEDEDAVLVKKCSNGFCVCCACLEDAFQRAKEKEIYYPVRCCAKDEPLMVDDYQAFFTEEFLRSYREKMIEYHTPPSSRVYCADTDCGAFICSALTINEPYSVCTKCTQWTCPNCICLLDGTKDGLKHHCARYQKDDSVTMELALRENVKRCPNCGILIEHTGDCNDMRCEWCKARFCFVCLQQGIKLCDCPIFGPSKLDGAGYEVDTGFNPITGLDREGYDRQGFNVGGFDRNGVHISTIPSHHERCAVSGQNERGQQADSEGHDSNSLHEASPISS